MNGNLPRLKQIIVQWTFVAGAFALGSPTASEAFEGARPQAGVESWVLQCPSAVGIVERLRDLRKHFLLAMNAAASAAEAETIIWGLSSNSDYSWLPIALAKECTKFAPDRIAAVIDAIQRQDASTLAETGGVTDPLVVRYIAEALRFIKLYEEASRLRSGQVASRELLDADFLNLIDEGPFCETFVSMGRATRSLSTPKHIRNFISSERRLAVCLLGKQMVESMPASKAKLGPMLDFAFQNALDDFSRALDAIESPELARADVIVAAAVGNHLDVVTKKTAHTVRFPRSGVAYAPLFPKEPKGTGAETLSKARPESSPGIGRSDTSPLEA